MSRHSAILEALRASGCRLTPQRVMIITTVAEKKGHIGIGEICERVKQAYPFVDVSTVYRTLQLLKKLHLVTETVIGGATCYELAEAEPHHHLICQGCGTTFALSSRYMETFRESLRQEFGFEPSLEHLAITGLCSRCRLAQ